MQILDVVLYSRVGQTRVVQFQPGRLNVISGDSKAGKSALIEIVRYCLGSSDFRVPAGVIADKVSWYGLRLQLPSGQAFVARQAPTPPRRVSTATLLRLGRDVGIPTWGDVVANTNIESAILALEEAIGLGDNETVVPGTGSRPSFRVTLSHALFFCVQRQGEIANQEILFHRQAEDFVPTAIRDSLPYLLGVLPDDYFRLRDRLTELRAELQALQLRESRLARQTFQLRTAALTLLAQALDAGLLQSRTWDDSTTPEDLRSKLAEALAQPPDELDKLLAETPAYDALLRERRDLVADFQSLQRTRELITEMLAGDAGFAEALQIHADYLEHVSDIPVDAVSSSCPLCLQEVPDREPSLAEVREDLSSVVAGLHVAAPERPRLRRALGDVDVRQEAIRASLSELDVSITAFARQSREADRIRRLFSDQSYVRGAIDQFLNATADDASASHTEMTNRVRALSATIESVERQIGYEAIRETMVSVLNVVGSDIARAARFLGLEYSDHPIRIDLGRLTVVADTKDGPVPLTRMGSGANWVGYHLATYLALQKFFTEANRPVPGFILLDQPSQVFYPPEELDADGVVLSQEDRVAVERMYELMKQEVNSLRGRLQIITMDHENPDRPGRPSVVAEEWRHGTKLIPADW